MLVVPAAGRGAISATIVTGKTNPGSRRTGGPQTHRGLPAHCPTAKVALLEAAPGTRSLPAGL